MRRIDTRALLVCAALSATGIANAQYTKPVDERSYNLGIIGGFAEVVRRGVKTLALSEVMTPEQTDDIMPDALVVAQRNGVELYRETDLIVTDLFPAGVAEGRHVLLIYTGDTLGRYLELKGLKAELVAAERYEGTAREAIARRFGRLLSYPEDVIDELLAATRAAQTNSTNDSQEP